MDDIQVTDDHIRAFIAEHYEAVEHAEFVLETARVRLAIALKLAGQ